MTSKTIIFDENLAYVKNLPYLCSRFEKTRIMKNKMYTKPIVEAMQLKATANLLAGSDTGLGIGDPISGGVGG